VESLGHRACAKGAGIDRGRGTARGPSAPHVHGQPVVFGETCETTSGFGLARTLLDFEMTLIAVVAVFLTFATNGFLAIDGGLNGGP
jgi:hypothetical protein